jgi:ferredoxin
MPVVEFVKQKVSIECPVGTNLRQLALANDIDLCAFPNNIFNCRGFALCGTCRVKVDEPRALSARTAGDESKNGWEGPQYRLACQSGAGRRRVITNPRRQMVGRITPPTSGCRTSPGGPRAVLVYASVTRR